MKQVKTRFAPSPTGYLHLGGARTALYSWAFAKKNNGEFLLRIEDTDSVRFTQESVKIILDGMDWLGLIPDNKDNIVYQTQNTKRYRELVNQLLNSGHAYYSYESKEELELAREQNKNSNQTYDRKWRPEPGKQLPKTPVGISPVVRFKMPMTGETSWIDAVKGELVFKNETLDDLIIMRSDGTPTYNFCVVVDDFDMGISHVIRGDDHVNNTPKQINILKALGADIPTYAHLPMILNQDGKKMSKRNGDTVAITDFDKLGILPEAMLNYLARLGWGNENDEFFTMNHFIDNFDLQNISSSPSRIDMDKLYWLNAEHIKSSDNQYLSNLIEKRLGILPKQEMIDLVKNRVKDLKEMADEVSLFYHKKQYDQQLTIEEKQLVKSFIGKLLDLPNDKWSVENIDSLLKDFCKDNQIKMKQIGLPLRIELFGTTKTASLETMLYLIGKNEIEKRCCHKNVKKLVR